MHPFRKILFTLLLPLLLGVQPCISQPGFKRYDSVPVKVSGEWLQQAWAGGLNACQFSTIDLNMDGIKDLFVFDKTANKISTFINNGKANTVDYTCAPQYRAKFPQFSDWALLVDYNCDEKEDIFTYSSGGMAIYRNTSDTINGLQFKLMTNLLYSKYNSAGLLNLYVSSGDIPAISDIDNDGDLDIVTFGLGSNTAEYHQNNSMELYGVCDSLSFSLNTSCWGSFAKSQHLSNDVSLGISCKGDAPGYKQQNMDHIGSCGLCLDIDGDLDKDIIIGDINYNNLNLVTNGGSISNANMSTQDSGFPSNTVQAVLASFPCAYYLDVNNDGLKDLLVSPNAAYVSNNFTSVWYYKNIGTRNAAIFEFQQKDFLQHEMIEAGEGAYPALFDYDNDGLLDLFIGNYGYYADTAGYPSQISFYKNIGSPSVPRFELVTRDFLEIGKLRKTNISPAFGDLDGDGDEDLLITDYSGKLTLFENTAGTVNPAIFILSQHDFSNINPGPFASPQIIDLDRDGRNDLLFGIRNGKLIYYKDTATTALAAFKLMTSNFGKVNVSQNGYYTGYNHPYMFDNKGSYELLSGSENGYLFYYTGIDSNLSGEFNLVDSMFLRIWEGGRSAPALGDINKDGFIDMVIGNYSGGVGYYQGTIYNSNSSVYTISKEQFSFDLFPNPATESISIYLKNGFSGAKKLTIFNLLGSEILTQPITENINSINIENLESGMYICQISSFLVGGQRAYKKFIVGH